MSAGRIQTNPPETKNDRIPEDPLEAHLHTASTSAKRTNETSTGREDIVPTLGQRCCHAAPNQTQRLPRKNLNQVDHAVAH